MNTSGAAALAQRLERFRALGRSYSQPARADRKAADSGRLADALGGRLERDVVIVESEFDVSVDRDALARLPFGIDPGWPLVALDTETTGLATAAGTLCFLVGLGTLVDDRLRVRQLLLTDHSVEPDFLAQLEASIPGDGCLVTYNGRSFDWPLLVARYRLHRRGPPPSAGHLDLLHVARRLWKHRLGSARLATVEQAICRVRRTDDLPGALIPERYFDYLRDRHAQSLLPIVEHNRQDVVSLVLLLQALTRLADPDEWRITHPGDVGALARSYAQAGDRQTALACLDAALASRGWDMGALGVPGSNALWRRLAMDRARLLARLDRRSESVGAWIEIARRGGPGAASAWLHVARHREHFESDPARALEACVEALGAAERARLWGRPVLAVERDLAWRMARLRRRVTTSAPRQGQARAA